ncbi:hypothetical protein [Niabella sp.]|uniref:hypothetical protein n=1 Tax=Niabella sp. TaxID=1962976 RepID=UPI002632A9DD|nr:hypothetical protein [Niabella sp.]
MKPYAQTVAATLFFMLGTSILSFGQNMYAGNTIKIVHGTTAAAKQEDSTESFTASSSAMTAHFLTLFPNATGQRWIEREAHRFVYFLDRGRKGTACFSPEGALSYAFIECRMEDLPKDFSKQLRKQYKTCQLVRATEITAHGQTAYQAIVENASGFVTLKHTPDGVEEIQTVKK